MFIYFDMFYIYIYIYSFILYIFLYMICLYIYISFRHWASVSGRIEPAKLLLSRGSDVNRKNKNLLTPLHMASENGRTAFVVLLLEHDADVTVANKKLQTAFDLAKEQKNKEICKILKPSGRGCSCFML